MATTKKPTAKRTSIAWLYDALDEGLRHDKRFRTLVLRMLAPQRPDEAWTDEANGIWRTRVIRHRPGRPTSEDLTAASSESPDALPPLIQDYLVQAASHWLAFQAKQHARAVAGVRAKREDRVCANDELRGRVQAARQKHPDYPIRAIAHSLLPPDVRADQKAVNALAKRIARLDRKK